MDETSLKSLIAALEVYVSYAANTRDRKVIELLNDLPVVQNLMILHPRAGSRWSLAAKWFVPAGAIVWAVGMLFEARTIKSVNQIEKIIHEIEKLYGNQEDPARLD